MKAVLIHAFGEPSVFTVGEIPEPILGNHDILVEAKAGSVNPIDCKQRKGNHRFLFGSPFPIMLGYDVSGTVLKTGNKVTDFKEGDAVCGVLNNKYGGALGQFIRGHQKCFAHIYSTLDPVQLAVLPLAGLTALQALRDKGKISSGKKVLIIGAAGGVGHFAIQVAGIYESQVFAVSSIKHKTFIDTLAENTFIDYTKENILELKEQFDIIFDTVGKYSFPKCKHLLLPGGIYINNLPRPKILFHKFLALFTRGKKVKTLLMHHDRADLQLLTDWVQAGHIKLHIDKEFSIHQMAEAHTYSEAGHTEGKILIRYDW